LLELLTLTRVQGDISAVLLICSIVMFVDTEQF